MRSLCLDQEGRIIIAGRFNSVAGTTRNGVARLGANGLLDASFDAQLGAATGVVNICQVCPSGQIVVSGYNISNRK